MDPSRSLPVGKCILAVVLAAALPGRQLGSLNSTPDIATPGVPLAFTLLGLLAFAPVLYHRLRFEST